MVFPSNNFLMRYCPRFISAPGEYVEFGWSIALQKCGEKWRQSLKSSYFNFVTKASEQIKIKCAQSGSNVPYSDLYCLCSSDK